MRIVKPASVGMVLLCLLSLSWPSPADAQTVPFKVFITEVWQLDADVDPIVGLIGDYYAKVTINGVEQDNNGACDDTSLTGIIVPLRLFKNFARDSACSAKTPWVFTAQVPPGQPVQVRIQIFDTDTIFDDEGDANPGNGSAIDLQVDLSTGQWSGDFSSPQSCSRPNLEFGSRNVNVCWSFDVDDDGLPDVWELSGVDTNADGTVDIDFPLLGANARRKDAFVEIDHLQASDHSHGPKLAAIAGVVTSYANAPVRNLDGTTGVQLHLDVGPLFGAGSIVPVIGLGGVVGSYGDLGGGNVITEVGNEIIDSFGGPGTAPLFADLKAAHFNAVRDEMFRYAIFGHQTNARRAENDCTSGQASRSRRDFLVTLGGRQPIGLPCWGTDGGTISVGSVSEQAGTLMHELGHTLGLGHGGDVDVNDKPNYLSVMNYSFQDCRVPTSPGLLPGECDYSRLVSGVLLPPLDETDLDECVGIAGGLGFGAVNWNGNGVLEGASACSAILANTTADVNGDGVCITPGANGRVDTPRSGDDRLEDNVITNGKNRVCDTAVLPGSDDLQSTPVGSTPSQPNPLTSFNDWDSLAFSLIDFPNQPGSGTSAIEQEPDSNRLAESRTFMGDLMAPGIVLDESGPATGKPGDVLTFTARVTNTGRGPALAAVLDEVSPDGTVRTSDLGIVPVGAEVTQTTTFTVPGNACPGDFAGGARASMSFKDFVAQPLTAADTAPLQILDVAPPTIDVSLSPSILWPPNHKLEEVTATIAVTDNCDRSPRVTLLSITSNEPAEGVIGQGDRGPDIQGAALGTDDRTFSLRAERGTGNGSTGRVYTVTYRVTDTSGNATNRSATVTVPTSNNGR
jgi:uncharacterized repeat protein (TIGR01451 family)